MDDVFKIALGIFIGSLAAVFTYEGIQTVRTEIALKKANEEMKRAVHKAEADAQAQQERAQEAKDEHARERQAKEREAADYAQLQRLRKQDKEDAFKRFFQPSERCAKDPVQGDCANAYMRAKITFESQYQPAR